MDMKALVFDLRLDSLFSIRLPYTWMSALTYPVLPPSAVNGLISNALQRYKNDKPPLECLKLVEENVVWAGSRLMSPCAVKSYIVSAIVNLEVKYGKKATNALVRQFAYTKKMQVVAILKGEEFIDDLKKGLTSTPLTCGDSESAVTVENVMIRDVKAAEDDVVTTVFPVPYDENVSFMRGSGKIYPMHDRCLKTGEEFPLMDFLVPIEEKKGVLTPTQITVKVKSGDVSVYDIEGLGKVVGFSSGK